MYHIKPHHNKFLHDYFNNKEMDELYLSVFLKYLAETMIGIFIPIYLLTLGYNLTEISIYFIIYFSSVSILFPLCMFCGSKIGIKKVMAAGTIILIIFYYLLNLLSDGFPYYAVALTLGLSVALYYSGFHLEFTSAASKKNEAKEFSVLKIIMIMSYMAGPLIGSIIIVYSSFESLFLIVSILLFISTIPLFLSRDVKYPAHLSLKKIIKSESKDKAIAYQSNGALNIIAGIFWPVFIFITLKNVISLGIIISLTSLTMIFLITILGRLSDSNPDKILKYGVFAHSSSWLFKIVCLTPLGMLFTNLFGSFTDSAIEISFAKKIYEKAENTKDIVNYFIFREFNLEIGRLLILSLAIIFNDLIWMFIMAMFITFGYLTSLKEHIR